MKRNFALRLCAACFAMLAAVILMTSCSLAGNNNTTPVDYTQLKNTTVPTFGKTTFTVTWNNGKILTDGTIDKDAEGFFYTDIIVLSNAKTTLELNIKNDSKSNADDYLTLSSYTYNASQALYSFNKDAAHYTGKDTADANSTAPAQKWVRKSDSTDAKFIYVSGNADECIRLCFPAEEVNDANISMTIQYTPSATATFTQAKSFDWLQLVIMIGMVLLLVVVFYFFMLRPQKKMQKETAERSANLAVGDEITTNSGIIGEIISIKDDTVTIVTGKDKAELRILKSAVGRVDVSAASKNASTTESQA